MWTIIRLTIQEARQRWLLWAVALLGVAFLIIFAVGFYFIYRDIHQHMTGLARLLEPVNFFVMAGLYGVDFLVVMLAVLTSVDTIAGEISSGAIQTIATKPLRRWEIVLGKWLGLAIMLSLFTLLMSLGMLAIVWVIAGYLPPNPASGIALMMVEGLVMLTLSILGGTRLSTLTNGVVVFMLYGMAFIAGWIEQIGAILRNATAVNIGIIVSLFIPSEAMWRRAAYLMEPPLLRSMGPGATPFSAASAPSPVMVVYTLAYVAILLALAVHQFQQRDL